MRVKEDVINFVFFHQGAMANQAMCQTNGELSFLNMVICFELYHLSIQCLPLQQIHFTDISPARILVQQKTLSENSDLYLTCSTFGSKKHTKVFVYLCKDDRGFKKMSQREDQNDSTFIISKVDTRHSGNYSCVYSKTEYSLTEVAKRGSNIIQILVIGKGFYCYESIMPVSPLFTHFLPLPCSQFSPCSYFSVRAVHCH